MIVSSKKAREARDALGIPADTELSEELITMSYRAASKKAHPDGGGSLEEFARVDWARAALTAWLKRQGTTATQTTTECHVCSGTGRIYLRTSGFGRGLPKQCPKCHGTGDAEYVVDVGTGG